MNLLKFPQDQLRKKVIDSLSLLQILIPISGLITPDSWKNYPVVLKKSAPIKKPAPETVVNKSAKRDEISKLTVEEPPIPKKAHTEKPKRERSTYSSSFSFDRSSKISLLGVSKPAVAETPKPVKRIYFASF
jgi:hypothetical protein